MKKRHTEKQIVIKLREIDILLGQGKIVGEACRYPNPTWKAPDYRFFDVPTAHMQQKRQNAAHIYFGGT